MPVPATDAHSIGHDEARSVGDIVELLDVIWENARQGTAAAPASASQLRLMYLVDRRPGIRMRALADLLGAAAPSVTRLCDRLEALAFIERHPCPDSGREITLRLTPAGQAHLARIRESREQTLSQALASMTSDNRRALATGLAALNLGITAAAGFPQQKNPPRDAAP
ncbi:MarR family winged helix-turn-helix transcriptional regulator [Streptomyces sp. NPDC060333]|uniref:MarR family winged helix-turn-helix transcriptional regulator n=1 Tax=Streptomyces sp. NPDC060333 TaxID=3347098 RepID=UPI0036618FDA